MVKGFVSKGDLEKSMNILKGDLRTMEEMMKKKMDNTMGHMEDNIVERILSSYKTQRKSFQKGMMWARVLMMIKIVLMLSNHPLISMLLEDLIPIQ